MATLPSKRHQPDPPGETPETGQGDEEMEAAGGVQPLQEVNAGETSFEGIRRDNLAYVDKTPWAAELAKRRSRVLLLRPRRFGKTLLLDTVQCLLERREELFRGLAAHAVTDWSDAAEVPVVRFDLSKLESCEGKQVFKDELRVHIRLNAARLGVAAPAPGEPGTMFMLLLMGVDTKYGKPAAVLIDEYDSPISRVLSKNGDQMNESVQEIRDALHSFVNVLKSSMELTWCQLLTGVTKFVLSDMLSRANHFRDRSHDVGMALACGFSWAEINVTYGRHIEALAADLGRTPESVRRSMDFKYGGWCFDGRTRVLNTWDVVRCFQEGELETWWLAEGLTAWLGHLLVVEISTEATRGGVQVPKLDAGVDADRALFESVKARQPSDAVAVYRTLMQAGYLTVTGIAGGVMTLAPPNHGVGAVLLDVVVRRLMNADSPHALAVKEAYRAGDAAGLLTAADRALDGTVYDHWKGDVLEHQVQAMFATVLTVCGVRFVAENTLRDGRCDFDVQLADGRGYLLIEMKVLPDRVPVGEEQQRAEALALTVEEQLRGYLPGVHLQRPGRRECWAAVYSRRKGRLLACHRFEAIES